MLALLAALLFGLSASLSSSRSEASPAGARGDSLAVLDTARVEFEAERYWHAAKVLEPLASAGALDPTGRLLYARALAGYRDWPEARATLERLTAPGDGIPETVAAEAWALLARAREETGAAAGAAEAYTRALADAKDGDVQRLTARRARALWMAGRGHSALDALDSVASSDVRSWLALEWLGPVVEAGDTAAVPRLLARIERPAARDRTWQARARARWVAGDTSGAVAAYRRVLEAEGSGTRRAVAWRILGSASLAGGDTVGAREAFAAALVSSGASPSSVGAARDLVALGIEHPDLALLAARTLDSAGDAPRALEAYDVHVALSRAQGREVAAGTRVERARLLAKVPAREEEAVLEFRALATQQDPAVGARALSLWKRLRLSQGRSRDAATLARWLVERYPSSPEAVDDVFFRADDAHDQNDLRAALAGYDSVSVLAPASDRAGLARLRRGHILLQMGDVDRASAVFERYLSDFPTGRRWEEAAYWAARTRLALGDTTPGTAHLARLRSGDPLSYYAVLTADLMGVPYEVDVPAGPAGPPPAWLAGALARVDLLDGVGLAAGARSEVEALGVRARRLGRTALYALAEALIERDHVLDGIGLGWELRRRGEPWSLRLLRIVYPFPYREMVLREAREWGIDPILLAGLIRQESAFVADIVSRAGAVGLMQVLPETGRGLARTVGPEHFTRAILESPEVNLHLGARFFAGLLDRYGPDLPLVLSAYNAGPSRARRWQAFPEAEDPLRFTERIPFAETRGYVKNVTRNQRLYEALYGPETRVAR